jgi:hypothetical protein
VALAIGLLVLAAVLVQLLVKERSPRPTASSGDEGWVRVGNVNDPAPRETAVVRSETPTSSRPSELATRLDRAAAAPSAAQAVQATSTSGDERRDMAKAADTAVTTYAQEGMFGLSAKTLTCYETNGKTLQCLYLDLASRRINEHFVAAGYPSHDFFSDSQFGARTAPVLQEANLEITTARSIARDVYKLVEEKFRDR